MEDQNEDTKLDTTTVTATSVLTIGNATAEKKLTAGRDVLYVARANSHQGLEGGVSYPAKVVRAWGNTCATIAVFTESEQFPLHVLKSISLDADGAEGTWHWPVLV